MNFDLNAMTNADFGECVEEQRIIEVMVNVAKTKETEMFRFEAKTRITMSKEAFNKKSLFVRSTIIEMRKRLVKRFVWSVLLYEYETWTLTKRVKERIEDFMLLIYRSTMRIK